MLRTLFLLPFVFLGSHAVADFSCENDGFNYESRREETKDTAPLKLDDYADAPLHPSLMEHHVFGDKRNPAIVLIHGLGGTSNLYRYIAQTLSASFYVVTISQRGHGATPSVGNRMAAELLARDVKAKLDSIGIDQTYVYGHSMGARTAVAFGGLYSRNTLGVIIDDMHMKNVTNGRTYASKRALNDIVSLLPPSFASRREAMQQISAAIASRKDVGNGVQEFLSRSLHAGHDGRWRLATGLLYSYQGLSEDLSESLDNITAANTPFLVLNGQLVLNGVGLTHLKEHAPKALFFDYHGHGLDSGSLLKQLRTFNENNELTKAIAGGSLDSFDQKPLPLKLVEYKVYNDENKTNGTILLIHGLGGSIESWTKNAPEVINNLSQDYRVVAYSIRGHGKTATVGNNYSLKTMSDDAAQLISQLGLGDVHVIGHSLGGRIAMQLATEHPNLVRSVIVEDMHFKGVRHAQSLSEMFHDVDVLKTFPPSFADRDALLMHVHNSALSGHMKGRLFHGPEDLVGGLDGRIRVNAWNIFVAAIGDEMGDNLRRLTKPTTFFAADQERKMGSGEPVAFLRQKGIDHIRESIPEAKIIIFEGSGHGIHVERQPEYILAVREHLEANSTQHRREGWSTFFGDWFK